MQAVHRIADDLEGWKAAADAEVLAGLDARLIAEARMDEIDAAQGRPTPELES